MKARVCNLHKTEAEWTKLGTWVPEAGELIVYDADAEHSYARIKMGDGVKPLRDLDFFVDSAILSILHSAQPQIIDAGRITNYKK